eukprot:SAG31_NODE_3339_length_4386_cov_39.128528_2_plen_101_part_00
MQIVNQTLGDTAQLSTKVNFKAGKEVGPDSRLETYRYYDPDRTEMVPNWDFVVKDCEVALGAARDAPKVVLPKVRIIAEDGMAFALLNSHAPRLPQADGP